MLPHLERAFRAARVLMLATWLVAFGATSAQALPDEAADLLTRAQSAASSALLRYDQHFPDQPEWRTALDLGRRAARLAPDHPAPQRFLAQAYGTVQWNIRAWNAWQAYIDLGGSVDAQAAVRLVNVARSLGIASFDAGRRAEALPYLETVVRYAPGDVAANARLARWYADQGEPERALPYLTALDAVGDEFDAFSDDVRRRARHGDAAADAFAAALAAQALGQTAQAITLYREAGAAAPDFAEAWRGLGGQALALGRFDEAQEAYEQVLALQPGDTAASEGLARAAAGVAAQAVPPAVAEAPAPTPEPAPVPEPEPPQPPAQPTEPSALSDPEPPPPEQQPADPQPPLATPPPEEDEPSTEVSPPTPAEEPQPADVPATPAAPVPMPSPEPAEVPVGAEQLVALNTQIAHRAASAGGSGAITSVDTPALARDLTAYARGTLELRVRVVAAPTDASVHYQVCLVPFSAAVAPACSAPDDLILDGSGDRVATLDLSGFGGGEMIAWREGIKSVMLVLRDTQGRPLDERALTIAERREVDLDRYFPTTVHVQAVLVAPGSRFTGWP